MRSNLLFLLAGIFLCTSVAAAQYEQELSRDLVRHIFILRNFYTENFFITKAQRGYSSCLVKNERTSFVFQSR